MKKKGGAGNTSHGRREVLIPLFPPLYCEMLLPQDVTAAYFPTSS